VLNAPGSPLDAQTRAFMEPRFGHDFSKVRVHTDAKAAESARGVNALAYTVGHDIAFGAGQYAPQTLPGRRLLAHELTHVAQQHHHPAVFQGRLVVGPADDVYEREADHFAERVTSAGGETIGGLSPARGVLLRRKCSGPEGGCVGGQWKFEYDGCSGLTGLAGAIVDATFDKDNPAGGEETQFANCLPSGEGGKACDRHDECYQTCHQDDGVSQSDCDVRMLEDMLDACSNSESDEELQRCSRWAKRYYQILRKFGWAAYRQRQKQSCGCEYESSPSKESKSSTSGVSPQGDKAATGKAPAVQEAASDTAGEAAPESAGELASETAGVSGGDAPQKLSACKPKLKSLQAVQTGTTVVAGEGREECELGLGVPGNAGMTFKSEVEVPAGCTGKLEYVQLISTCRERRDADGVNNHLKSDWFVLDTRDPKAEQGVASPGTSYFESSDSPGSATRDSVYLSVHDDFHMYLLWTPDVPPKAPRVPLGVVPWHWIVEANKTGDTGQCAAADWTISDGGTSGGTGVEIEHDTPPSWTRNVMDLVPSKGPC
jgi:hypothetical protein